MLLDYFDVTYGHDLKNRKSKYIYIYIHTNTFGDGCISCKFIFQKYLVEFTTKAKYVITLETTKNLFD